MPVNYVIDRERRVVISTASDRVTFAEFMDHQDRLRNDPDFRPEFNQVIDATSATDLEISASELRVLTSRRVFSAESKRAFVAARPDMFGVARMAEIYLEMSMSASRTRVFHDLASALKWIGLGEPDGSKT